MFGMRKCRSVCKQRLSLQPIGCIRGSVTITIERSTNGATTLSRMNLCGYVGHATIVNYLLLCVI